jgi:hypothetical protein
MDARALLSEVLQFVEDTPLPPHEKANLRRRTSAAFERAITGTGKDRAGSKNPQRRLITAEDATKQQRRDALFQHQANDSMIAAHLAEKSERPEVYDKGLHIQHLLDTAFSELRYIWHEREHEERPPWASIKRRVEDFSELIAGTAYSA